MKWDELRDLLSEKDMEVLETYIRAVLVFDEGMGRMPNSKEEAMLLACAQRYHGVSESAIEADLRRH